MAIDLPLFKQTMAQWAAGVSVITTQSNGELHGMTVSSFTSVSLDPMLVMVSVGKELTTHRLIQQSGVFAVNILKTSQIEWGKIFAGMYQGVTNRFEGIDYRLGITGSPILPDVLGWLDCRVWQAYDGGDHTLFLGEVLATEAQESGDEPLLYYHRSWGGFTHDVQSPGLTHIVLFKLHDPTPENLNAVCEGLVSLKAKIPEIIDLEVGINIIESDRSYDLALTVWFDSIAALEAYQVHPEHVRVVSDIIKPRVASRVAVDYGG